ncbi:MAG: hypothetical protein JKY65_02600 [Planctomycetes bacterium]|nr:hypothetical protein [Planctomycetota bacterium]
MRAYVRSRSAIDLEISGTVVRDLNPDPRPAVWGRFSGAIEQACEGAARKIQPTIRRIAHCGGLSVGRSFTCGQEDQAIDAWCGHAYCPACAKLESTTAAQSVRDGWDSRLITIEVAVDGDLTSPALPNPSEVAVIRATWAEISKTLAERTGLPRLESVPRVLISPQSVTLFVRHPFDAETARECLVEAVREACHSGGLDRSTVSGLSRERAAGIVRRGLSEQSRRFVAGVERDLGRGHVAWRGSFPGDASNQAADRTAARGWIAQIEAHHTERRRKRVLGSKGCLPAPAESSAEGKKAVCSRHGSQCHVIVTRVRERATGDLVIAYPGDQVPATTGPQAATFFANAARDGIRRSRPFVTREAASQLRRAG